MSESLLDELDVRAELRRACAAAGSQRAWAQHHNIDEDRVSYVLTGARGPTKDMLDALGFERTIAVTKYRKKKQQADTTAA